MYELTYQMARRSTAERMLRKAIKLGHTGEAHIVKDEKGWRLELISERKIDTKRLEQAFLKESGAREVAGHVVCGSAC